MAVDLHTHSDRSDGSLDPAELVVEAAAAGLTAVALTDHDTLEGVAEARTAGASAGIEVVGGIELSLTWSPGGMHMIVLFLDDQPGPLQDHLEALRSARADRNARMLTVLAELGMEITPEELAAEAGQGSAGRPHLAAIMVRKGYVPDVETAFNEWLAAGRPAYLGRDRLSPEEAIPLARASGGVPILAHPHSLGLETPEEMSGLYERLAGVGLVGVECFYSTYDTVTQAAGQAQARKFGLIPSGGSDFHGSYKPTISLGSGTGELYVPDEVLEELRAARP
jgi:predicted metal-dependent phosphoesterase TrpH